MKVDCYPVSLLPRQSRLFLDYTSSHEPISPFFVSTPWSHSWASSIPPQDQAHRSALADLILQQNRGEQNRGEQNRGWLSDSGAAGENTLANIERLRNGAGARAL